MKLIKVKNYWICKGKRDGESNCNKIFENDDDNVCSYCGSKNVKKIEYVLVANF